jgi:23S rRNA (guanosine2251-2'-O)-methyltransferase
MGTRWLTVAGNTGRRGAVRKSGSKKGQVVGSGGQRRRGLEGKGPTPPGEMRPGHPKARRAAAAAKRKPGGGSASKRRAGGRGRPEGTEIVAGRNAVVEAMRADVPVKALYVADRIDSDDRVREVIKLAADRDVAMLEAPRSELDRITDGAVHQGLALTVPPYEYAHPDDLLEAAAEAGEPPLIVALDSVTDPRNLGAVVRSAAAFGAHGVVVGTRRSAGMTVGAWKTSAGAAARIPVARATNVTRTLKSYADAGLFIVGLAGEGSQDVADVDVADGPLCLVVGSEGSGMSRVVAEACDVVARIPIARDVESLNAGVAASIALYEISRSRA